MWKSFTTYSRSLSGRKIIANLIMWTAVLVSVVMLSAAFWLAFQMVGWWALGTPFLPFVITGISVLIGWALENA